LSRPQAADIASRYELPPDRVIVAGAGYSDTLFQPGEKGAPPPVQVVYAGKLWNAKGLPWLLEALQTIRAPDWRLHLVGGGSGRETEACLRLAQALGERVVIHGQIPQTRLASLFRQAHIFVLPSLFEGLPLVVLEALASGCRVVATELPGVLEVLGDVRSEAVTLVPTPRLRNMDQPFTEDLPAFGDPEAPIHKHVADRYLQESGEEIGIPNVVTSVLASYRGYDTLGETTVIFTAGVGVMAILGVVGGIRRRRRDGEPKEDGK
jgi:hypothetical protein